MAKEKAVTNESVRVIKKEKCPALSGKSELIYCLGSDPDNQLMIRIYSNTGGGFFSDEWLSVPDILSALETWDPDRPITSAALTGLFRGQSVNTPAFLIAALKAESLLVPIEGKQRVHELGDTEAFLARAKQLQSGKPAPKKKTPAKAKAVPAKKKAALKSKKKTA